MAGTLTISTLSDGTNSTSATNCIQGSAKAWVNFDGTLSSPITARASYNVTDVTKTATGQYTVNFTTAMPNANYCAVVTTRRSTSKDAQGLASLGPANSTGTDLPMAVGSVNVATGVASSGAFTDFDFVCVTIFR